MTARPFLPSISGFGLSPGDDLIDLLKSGVSVRPSVCTSVYVQSFYDFDLSLIWYVGGPRPDMRTSVTSTRSKVKVTDLLQFRKLHFSTSTSSAILAWRSQLMGDCNSMGPSLLQVFGTRFLNFSPVGGQVTSKFAKC